MGKLFELVREYLRALTGPTPAICSHSAEPCQGCINEDVAARAW